MVEKRTLQIPESLDAFLCRLYREYYKRINNGKTIGRVGDGEIIAMILVCAMKYDEIQNLMKTYEGGTNARIDTMENSVER